MSSSNERPPRPPPRTQPLTLEPRLAGQVTATPRLALQRGSIAGREPVTAPPAHTAPDARTAPPSRMLGHAPAEQFFDHVRDPFAEPRLDTLRPQTPQTASSMRPSRTSIDDDLYAPTRSRRSERAQANVPIIEGRSVTGRSLTLVIAIMCCLACLTAGAVYLMNQSASAWLRDIASEVTIQVEPREKTDIDKTLREVTAFVTRQPGIRSAKPLSLDDQAGLLEPWLGQSDVLKSLPVPRLVAIELDRASPPDLTQLRTTLLKQFPGVTLDDHRQWQQQIRAVTRSFALGGLAILMLVGAATTAIIVSATKSALASNRDIVEVLHFVGATDRFIAREFERHFLRLGVRAGLVGAAVAMAVFVLLPSVMELLGGGAVTLAEIRRLVGAGVLDGPGYMLLSIVVVVIAALCMLTSRIGVYRILNSQH